MLSAMAHGADDVETAVKIALTGIVACASLPEEPARIYSDLIRSSLSEAARRALEELMASAEHYEYQSEFARRHIAEARSQAIIAFLEARGLTVTDEPRARVLACTDLDQLAQWIRKAATVTTVDALF